MNVKIIYSSFFHRFQGSFRCGSCNPGYDGDSYRECKPVLFCSGAPRANPCGYLAHCIPRNKGRTYECQVNKWCIVWLILAGRCDSPNVEWGLIIVNTNNTQCWLGWAIYWLGWPRKWRSRLNQRRCRSLLSWASGSGELVNRTTHCVPFPFPF
jgi:hypothetical protein